MDGLSTLRGADLALLVSLDMLLEEANVTRAAQRLHLSQPALSAQLARLRVLLADPLLVPARHGRGMVPTARALAIAEPLRAALRQMRAALDSGARFDPAVSRRTFQVLASDNSVVMLGIDLLARVARLAPGIAVGFQAVAAESIAGWIDSGRADLVIAADFSIPDGLKARPLLHERYVLGQRRGHPRGTSPPDLDEYCALTHVLVSGDGGGFHGFMDEVLARHARRRTVAVSVQQYHLAPLVLAATDHVCVMPERFAQRFADRLDAVALPVAVGGFNLSVGWHPRDEADPAHRWLREQLFAVAAPEPPPSSSPSLPWER